MVEWVLNSRFREAIDLAASTATTSKMTAPSSSTKATAATLADPASNTSTECHSNVTNNSVSSGTLQPSNNYNNFANSHLTTTRVTLQH